MDREQWVEIVERIPVDFHSILNLVLVNGVELSVDGFIIFERQYMVVRGRVSGSTDEGRGFIIPYDQITYMRLERTLKVTEIQSILGLASESVTPAEVAEEAKPEAEAAPPERSANPSKANLLDMIKRARENSSRQGG